MLTTPELITALERRGVLAPSDVARVRQLHENSPTEFVPRVLFKWLVSRGRMTLDEADRLLAIDPNLSAVDALEQVLGRNDNLELAPDEDDVYDEDTKEMLPAGEAGDDIQLPPRGTAPFADSPEKRKQPLIPTNKTPPETKELQPAAAAPYADLFDELLGAAGEAGPGLNQLPTNRSTKGGRFGRWDSPLMLAGGGGLLLLVMVSAFLIWRIVRQGGDDAFAAAEESYRNAGYASAVERYDQFLTKYPQHRFASTAVVHRGLARLRLVVESASDWPRALATAQTVLGEIASQPEFAASKADLSALLPDIAENLAKTALAKPDDAELTQAREARKLIDKYGVGGDAVAPRLQQIDGLLATAERRQSRARLLRETVAAMNAAALARDLAKAAQAQQALLTAFPDAAAEPTLLEAAAGLADVKRSLVRFIAEDKPAEKSELASPIVRKVTLASRTLTTAAQAEGVAFATLEGTLFALNFADGRILWTRAIGYDSAVPARVDDTADADVVVYDGVQQMLVRLSAKDGVLRWRQPLEPGGRLAVERERISVTLKNRLQLFETATGKLLGQVDFPSQLGGPSAVDPRGKLRYQLADADDLYVLSNDDSRCLQTFFLGHASRSIDVPPICVGPYVLTTENVGDRAQLTLLEVAADGTTLTKIAERTVNGRVTSTPQVSQRIVAVVTDSGGVDLFDLAGSKDRKPLDPIAHLAGSDDREIVRRHFTFRDTQLWVGGKGLTRFEFQPTLNRLSPIRSLFPERTTLQPPQRQGSVAINVAQPIDFSSPRSVVAVDAESGSVLWETFPVPSLCGPPIAVEGRDSLTCVTGLGGVYSVPVAGSSQIFDYPQSQFAGGLHPAEGARPAVVAKQALVYLADVRARTDAATTTATLSVPLLSVALTGTSPATTVSKTRGDWIGDVVPFDDGVLVATAGGQLQAVDYLTGEKQLEPFQPPLLAGRRPTWSRAAVVGEQIVVSDGRKLFVLGVESQPQPFLKARTSIDLVRPTIPEVAAVGETAYLVDGTGELTAYHLPDLKPGTAWKARGAGYWGPKAVGSHVYALAGTTGEAQLLCLTGDGRLAWKATVPARSFAPVLDGEQLLLTDERGDLIRLDATNGKEIGRTRIGIPLAAEPVVSSEGIVLTTQAGELLWLAKP